MIFSVHTTIDEYNYNYIALLYNVAKFPAVGDRRKNESYDNYGIVIIYLRSLQYFCFFIHGGNYVFAMFVIELVVGLWAKLATVALIYDSLKDRRMCKNVTRIF